MYLWLIIKIFTINNNISNQISSIIIFYKRVSILNIEIDESNIIIN